MSAEPLLTSRQRLLRGQESGSARWLAAPLPGCCWEWSGQQQALWRGLCAVEALDHRTMSLQSKREENLSKSRLAYQLSRPIEAVGGGGGGGRGVMI